MKIPFLFFQEKQVRHCFFLVSQIPEITQVPKKEPIDRSPTHSSAGIPSGFKSVCTVTDWAME